MLTTMHPFDTLEFIGVGKSGIVRGFDAERVIKEHDDQELGDIERLVYKRLGPHPNIAKCFDTTHDGCIMIERGQVVREIHQQHSMDTKLPWLLQAATGLRHIHDHGIVHADVGTHNMIIGQDGTLKIIDFEGCSVDGAPADSCYEWFSYRPSEPPVTRQTDIFAFGCVVHELVTGHPPYQEFRQSDCPSSIVEELYKRNQFPHVTDGPFVEIITNCWTARFNSMDDLISALHAIRSGK